jgi:hypothetical protein
MTFDLAAWLQAQPAAKLVMLALHWYEHCFGALDAARIIEKVWPQAQDRLLRMLNPCHTLDPMSPMSRQPEVYGMQVHYRTFMDYYNEQLAALVTVEPAASIHFDGE